MFSNAPPNDIVNGEPLEGDDQATEFGAAVVFGVFRDVDTSGTGAWRNTAVEFMAVGAPLWQGTGAVHIFESGYLDLWLSGSSLLNQSGDHACNRDPGLAACGESVSDERGACDCAKRQTPAVEAWA
jgi:hypothetical protein